MTERKTWDTIGENDPYCGTGGPTRAMPLSGKFAKPDSALLTMIENKPIVLDLGCGYGRNSLPLRDRNENIIACDVSLAMSRTVRRAKIPFVMCDVHRLPFRDGSVDCLICSHVLQHLRRKDIGPVLEEIKRVAKQSLIVMPNPMGVASFFGLKPIFHALAMLNKGTHRKVSEDIPTLRGYIVNYYLPWSFSTLARRFFDEVKMSPGNIGEKLPMYLTSCLLYICS
jgi:ubiquinone/menaquinone biosynthesis C-methylase UbiE